MVNINNKALSDYLIDISSEGFEWGVCDCVTFAVTGAGYAWNINLSELLPNWHDEASAKKVIRSLGKDLREASHNHLPKMGLCLVETPQAGDIAVANLSCGITFCLCINNKMMAAMSKNGILFYPVSGEIWRKM